MDQARKEEVGQFDKHPKVGDLCDDGFESLTGVGPRLHLEILQKFEFFGFLLRLSCSAFRAGKMLGEGIEGSALHPRSAFRVGEGTMDEEIGIAADGGGEVGIVGFRQTEMSETFGRVDGPFEGAKKTDLEGVAIRTTGKKFKDFLNFSSLSEVARFDAVGDEKFPIFE